MRPSPHDPVARPRAPLLLLAAVLALSACGPPPPPELAPGTGLFDLLGPGDGARARVPETNLTAEVGAALLTPQVVDGLFVAGDRWRDQGPPDAALARLAREHGVVAELHAWICRLGPRKAERFAAGDWPHLSRDGVPVERFTWGGVQRLMQDPDHALTRDGGGPPVWADRGAALMVWWDAARGLLAAVSPHPPGDLQWRVRPDLGTAVLRFEPTGRGADAADTVPADLVTRLPWGVTTRRALVLPAPGALTLPRRTLRGDALDLAVGVPDHAFTVDLGEIVRDPGGGDGVTFVVDVMAAGGVTEAWRRHVTVDEGLVTGRVDLSAFTGRPVELRLRSLPGPDGDAAWDYGAWHDLRVVGTPRRPPRRPHVVLIDIDTLRADRMGMYGHDRDTTPRLDAWAARRAVVYTDVMATASWTIPSTASILTGLHVHQHRLASSNDALGPETPSLATLLHEAGYETRAFADLGFVSPSFGFDLGFDLFTATVWKGDEPTRPDWQAALDWVSERHSERPLFLFLHTYMVHDPYHDEGRFPEPHPDEVAWLTAEPAGHGRIHGPVRDGTLELDALERAALLRMYDEGVQRMDEVVGAFLDGIEARLGGDPCLVILTSDHGEEFFEHGSLGHGHTLHREVLRVPLLVAWPGDDGPVGTDGSPVSTLDIVPTVLRAAGATSGRPLPGRALQDPVPAPRPRLAMLDDDFALSYDGWKLIHPGWPHAHGVGGATTCWWAEAARDAPTEPTRVFALRDDPDELFPVEGADDRRARLEELLGRRLRRNPPATTGGGGARPAMDAETRRRLAELGYLRDG